MNIIDFRKQYPMYDDISDNDVANKLYTQNYSDMDRKAFMDRFLTVKKSEIKQQEQPEITGEEYYTSPGEMLKESIGTIGRTAGMLAGSAVMFPVAGFAGYAKLLTSGPDEAVDTIEKLATIPQKMLKKNDMRFASQVSWPFEKISESAQWWGDYVLDVTGNSELAALTSSGVEAAVYLGLPKLKFKLLKSLRDGNLIGYHKTLREMIARDKLIANQKQQPPMLPELIKREIGRYKAPEKISLEKLGVEKGPLPVEPEKPITPISERLKEIETKGKEAALDESFKRQKQFGEPLKRGDIGLGEKAPMRSVREILKDVNELMGKERGSMSFEDLNPKQKDALQRLVKDASKAKKEVGQFMKDLGYDSKSIAILQRYTSQLKEPVPQYAQSVNLDKQDIPESAKRLEMAIAKEKTPIGWEKTVQRSEMITDVDKLYNRLDKIKKGKLTADIYAAREINAGAMKEFGKVVDDYVNKKISIEELNDRFNAFDESVFRITSEASSEIGRALNIHKKEISGDRIAQGLSKLEKSLNDRQITELNDILGKLKEGTLKEGELNSFLDRLPDPALKDYVLEYWYNMILSGIPTHVVNVATNTGFSLYQIPHRVHSALWDKVITTFTGKERTRYVNEMIPMMAGYIKGFKRGASGAKQMIKDAQIADFETKWAQEVGRSSIGAWERSPNETVRKLAPAVTMSTRALRAMDVWANSMAYDSHINSLARRASNKKGLKGKERIDFENKFKKSPPDYVHDEAMKFAKHNTFMDDPDPFTQAFIGLREKVPFGIGRFVVPFVNTISNLTKRGIELTPGLGIVKEIASRQMGRGMPLPEIISKQVEGSLLALYIYHKVSKGEITGETPQNKAEREAMYRQGKKPWSMKVGDSWYQYRRAEPWNTVIASVAVAYDKIKNAKDDETATQIFGDVAKGLANNLLDSSYFQGLQQVFDRYQKFETAPQRMLASFVPYSSFWRSINRAYEKLTEGDAKVREQVEWLGAFAQVIPGLSGQIPAQIDVWGNEKIIPGSVFQHWLPYKWSKEIDDPVEKELARLKIYPALPSQTVKIDRKETKFDDDIYKSYCLVYGRNAKQALDYIVTDKKDIPENLKPIGSKLAFFKKAYQHPRLDDETKQRILHNAMTTIRNATRLTAIMEQKKK